MSMLPHYVRFNEMMLTDDDLHYEARNALLPLLRDWPEPENEEQRQYLTRIQRAVQDYAARYPDYLVPGGSAAVQNLNPRRHFCPRNRRQSWSWLLTVTTL